MVSEEQIEVVHVDYRSESSIRRAEMRKQELENAGYNLRNTLGTFDVFDLVYIKQIA